MARADASESVSKSSGGKSRGNYLRQNDVPRFSLVEALRIPRAIWENYGGEATAPLKVAAAMDMKPNSSHFRMLAGAALAYGLVNGGPKAAEIGIEDLGMRILRPLEEGDDLTAKREALLQPRVVREFIEKYANAPLPRPTIAQNVLEDMGVPRDKAAEVHDLILEGAREVGLIQEIKGQAYVDLSGTPAPKPPRTEDDVEGEEHQGPGVPHARRNDDPDANRLIDSPSRPKGTPTDTARARRVFVTHGKNRKFIEPIKKLLGFGDMEAVIAAEKQSVAQPVPDKVMETMRSCGAAIIHVDAERTLLDPDGEQQVVLNPNVLIEIGAAMALFDRRFVLLVREGVKLPSNLQGLYEVRYEGEALDADATIRLLEAINDIKKRPIP